MDEVISWTWTAKIKEELAMKLVLRSTRVLARVVGVVLLVLCGSESYGANALSGVVSSAKEGRMEGVLVSAKRESSNITVTVVSDSQGCYAFLAGRLPAGSYRMRIRAVGYDLNDPGVVRLEDSKAVQLDLTLTEIKDLASQLTTAEWLMSIPATPEQNRMVRESECTDCHSLATVLRSKYDAKSFLPLIERMRNYSEASLRQDDVVRAIPNPYKSPLDPGDDKLAEYYSSVNLSSSKDGKWSYELKVLPRPTGRATRVIITEYDLPRRATQPHDVTVDADGMVWYVDIGDHYFGRLNPRTGEVKEWKPPILKPGFPAGSGDIRLDKNGDLWIAMRQQGGVARFDKETEEFTSWSPPPEYITPSIRVGKMAVAPNGPVWFKNGLKLHRLDPGTGEVMTIPMPNDFYGLDADSQGNVYLASLRTHNIGEVNAKTGEFKIYPTPTPLSGPRRGNVDLQGRYWFGEYFAGKIGMFDPKTKQIKEWTISPAPYSNPYDAIADKNGDVWSGGEFTDNIYRLDPATGQTTSYLLPTLEMNIQRIDVDNSASPVTIWVGENHQGKIARIEPLD
jgi:streptogramin lyase